jgi:hypothetical protein
MGWMRALRHLGGMANWYVTGPRTEVTSKGPNWRGLSLAFGCIVLRFLPSSHTLSHTLYISKLVFGLPSRLVVASAARRRGRLRFVTCGVEVTKAIVDCWPEGCLHCCGVGVQVEAVKKLERGLSCCHGDLRVVCKLCDR